MSSRHSAASPEEARGSQGSPCGSRDGRAQRSPRRAAGGRWHSLCPSESRQTCVPWSLSHGCWRCAGLRGCGGRPLFPRERKQGPERARDLPKCQSATVSTPPGPQATADGPRGQLSLCNRGGESRPRSCPVSYGVVMWHAQERWHQVGTPATVPPTKAWESEWLWHVGTGHLSK